MAAHGDHRTGGLVVRGNTGKSVQIIRHSFHGKGLYRKNRTSGGSRRCIRICTDKKLPKLTVQCVNIRVIGAAILRCTQTECVLSVQCSQRNTAIGVGLTDLFADIGKRCLCRIV